MTKKPIICRLFPYLIAFIACFPIGAARADNAIHFTDLGFPDGGTWIDNSFHDSNIDVYDNFVIFTKIVAGVTAVKLLVMR